MATDGGFAGGDFENEVPFGDGSGAIPGNQKKPRGDQASLRNLKLARTRFLAAFAQITLSLAATPRYRHQTLADLDHLLLAPLMQDRVAVATVRSDDEDKGGSLVGAAIWASVSEEVDRKIHEQINAHVFPIRLKPDEWKSGEINWLLDLIAPTRKLRTALLGNLGQVFKNGNVRIHPNVSRLVDGEMLKNATHVFAERPPEADRPN